jgi:hypothetical protein
LNSINIIGVTRAYRVKGFEKVQYNLKNLYKFFPAMPEESVVDLKN